MGRPSVEMIGKQYFNWLILDIDSTKSKENGTKYICECTCGTIRSVSGSHIRAGLSKSCRKCGSEQTKSKLKGKYAFNRKAKGEAQRNALFQRYLKSASMRNILFELTIEDFESLTKATCHYCGIIPSQVSRGKYTHGDYTYNGIDRIDNTKGYTLANCVPCCKFCNRAKDTLSKEAFLSKIENIYKHALETMESK